VKVLVTGGRGLLGGAVVHELVARGHEVTTLQRSAAGHPSPVHEVRGDVTDRAVVRTALRDCNAVVHMAAKVSMVGEWSDFESVNVGGTRNVLDESSRAGVERFVYVSSPSVAHSGRPLVGVGAEPADPRAARGSYARSKAAAELLVLAADDLATVAVRPHLVWGPGDRQLIARIAERARRGRLVYIDDGAALIDTTYVDNAATAIAQALDRCTLAAVRGRPFVVSNGEPRTVREILSRIAVAAGARPPHRGVPLAAARAAGGAVELAWGAAHRTGEPAITRFVAEQLATAHWFDQRDTRESLAWAPQVSLDEGFRRLAASLGSSPQ
jgi:nucleoside-diphosphate-sugar epimerase